MPENRMIGACCFCPVCLSVVNFNISYNCFNHISDRDFIFGMHTPLMRPFQKDIKVNDLVTSKYSFSDFVAVRGIVFHKDFFLCVFRIRAFCPKYQILHLLRFGSIAFIFNSKIANYHCINFYNNA